MENLDIWLGGNVMDVTTATKIVSALVNGVDPFTGEVLAASGPYQNPDTVRALFLALEGLEVLAAKGKRNSRLPTNAGKQWSSLEDEELVKAFDAGVSINELSSKHGRTLGSIKARLVMFGKTQAEPAKLGVTCPWTAEEDEGLVRDFETGVSCKELSSMYERNVGLIQSRLIQLGKKVFDFCRYSRRTSANTEFLTRSMMNAVRARREFPRRYAP